ncbi:Uncharacterised protein [Shigella sonnei]|nr:Uncharacterised protein [Shigella sonnei]
MRVFTAKDRVDFNNFTLEIESFEIVGKAHQVSFWRQFVLRVPPVAIAEDPQLPAFNKFFQAVLYVEEIARG